MNNNPQAISPVTQPAPADKSMNNGKMLTIDLLKGQGIPVRSDPDKIALTMVMLEVPLFIAIMMLGCYLNNNVMISIQKQKILNYSQKISKLSQAATLQEEFLKEKENINGCMSEVSANISKHFQWTPFLVEVVKIMPDSILLTGIDVKQDEIKKKIPSKTGIGEGTELIIPVKRMQIKVAEKSGTDGGQSVRDFQASLRSSAVFGPRLDNINVSQGVDSYKGRDVVSYQIECTFKPQL
jgi:hypothetical protein